jgi:hypothetical protein
MRRKKAALAAGEPWPPVTEPHQTSKEQRRIAAAIQLINVTLCGGACYFYNVAGLKILQTQGYTDFRLVRGGMIYRSGPDPLDGIFFCGPDNVEFVHPLIGWMGHWWIESEDRKTLIDFSMHQWREGADRDAATMPHEKVGLKPIQWDAPPTSFYWGPREGIADSCPRPGALPRVGRAFYTPNYDATPEHSEDMDYIIEMIYIKALSKLQSN